MDYYDIWVNLAPGAKDLEFVAAVEAYLGALKAENAIDGFQIRRRKFGFGPESLGEFSISIRVVDLAQLDSAFNLAAPRTGDMERLHAAVFSRVTDFKAALYRDFPDPVRAR